MGNRHFKTAEDKLELRKQRHRLRVDKKMQARHQEWVLFLGPAGHGKSTLFQTLLDQIELPSLAKEEDDHDDSEESHSAEEFALGDDFFPPYEKTEQLKIGLKIFETTEDKYLFPLCARLIDSPGSLQSQPGQAQFAFSKPSIIFLVFDYSSKLNKQAVVDWTQYALEGVQRHHPSFTQGVIPESTPSHKFDGLVMKSNVLLDSQLQTSQINAGALESERLIKVADFEEPKREVLVPPRIVHVFSKADFGCQNWRDFEATMRVQSEARKIKEHNDEIIEALVSEGWVEQHLFTGCKPLEGPQRTLDGKELPERCLEQMGLSELREVILSNKKLMVRPSS